MTGQAATAVDSVPDVEPHTPLQSVAFHLLPGVAVLAAFVVLVPPLAEAGYPTLLALAVAIPLVLVPVELGSVFYAARRRGVSITALAPYQESLSK